METKQALENSRKNLETIINKAWEDESFKQELIANPAQAIEKLSGKPFDAKGSNIVVTDQTAPNTVYINIPANPGNMELTDVQLEAVAGGAKQTGITILWTGICVHW
ncbi:NHLP leader peptide family RiPP precursor [Chryseobacterium sp. Mn2064]|uniref:NHLP leader peptide family RiPP precursor n=1 Tax=Chryseobacterium sp. Mn2064 TaxID=3395263 RepID=UPI003BE830C8